MELSKYLNQKNGKYFDIYNIGRGKSIKLQTFISTLENILKTKSKKTYAFSER